MKGTQECITVAVVTACMTLALGGCAVGPDFHRPAPPNVDGYTREPLHATASVAGPGGTAQRFEPGGKILREWWTVFGSATLNEWVAQAFQHNPTLDSANAALRQAQENTAAQRGAYFPTLQANYSLSRQRQGVGTISPTLTSGEDLYTLHTAQLSISYAPDVFGLNRRTVESLVAQEEAQRFQLNAAYLTLAANVVAAAIEQAALRAQIVATKEIIRAEARVVELLHRQAELGFASGLDVAAQETVLAQAQQALPPLTKQLEQTRDLLAVLAGKFPSQGGAENVDLDALRLPEALPIHLPSVLVEQRPDVQIAQAQLHAASAQVGIAVANRFPQFSISATDGGNATRFSQMFADSNKFWGITGNIVQTIFDAATLKHRQGAAEAALDQVAAQYRSTVLTAFQNVADTLYALDADAQALEAAVKAETATQKSFDLTRRQLELGFVNAITMLSAEQAFQQTKITRIQAQAARYADTAALFQALGGGWSNLDPATAGTPNNYGQQE